MRPHDQSTESTLTPEPTPADSAHRARLVRRVRIGAFACVVLAFGLLLWARFILVTGHPRTAYATPEQPATAAAPAPMPDVPSEPPSTPVDQADAAIGD